MLTLKFQRTDFKLVIATPYYEEQARHPGAHSAASPRTSADSDVGATIIANGTEYHIGDCGRPPGEPTFDVCFVENQAGKTIDRIGPFNMPVEPRG